MSNEFEVRSDLNNEYVGGLQMLIINKGKELADQTIPNRGPSGQVRYEQPVARQKKKIYSKPLEYDKNKYFEHATEYDQSNNQLNEEARRKLRVTNALQFQARESLETKKIADDNASEYEKKHALEQF